MNLKQWLHRKPPQRKRSLHDKVDHIEEVVETLEDTVGKLHADMWDKLTTLEEQSRARPSIVLDLPPPDGSLDSAGYEPFEAFEPFDDGRRQNDEQKRR